MNLAELEAYVVERLGDGVAQEDVILEVTERGALTWPEAEALVRRTSILRSHAVAHRQIPILALVAAAVILGGVALVVACALSFSDALLLAQPLRGDADRARAAALLSVLVANSPSLGLLPLGAGMILGGILGLHQALRATSDSDP